MVPSSNGLSARSWQVQTDIQTGGQSDTGVLLE